MEDRYGNPWGSSENPRRYGRDWRKRGPYTGRGPRGYQRSDERIREEVCERLTEHGLIDARYIRVLVKDGEVTLQGTVQDWRTKRRAEDTAASVAAVSDVHNLLRFNTLPGRKETHHETNDESSGHDRLGTRSMDRRMGGRTRKGALVFETNGDKEE
jgi:hypothetical protein